MNDSPMVEIENLFFAYKDRAALRGVSLTVERAEIFGLLGPNGRGKPTLFRILSTAFKPQAGSAHIGGLDAVRDSAGIREKIGVVFQTPSLDGRLTVMENLLCAGQLYGLHGANLRGRAEEMLSRLGVLDRAKDYAARLSGGLKRRVEIAKSLLHRPVVLILDEPSTGLDPGARADMWRYLKSLHAEGVTVLVTTHLMEEAEHCNHLAILHEGKVAAAGSPDEMKHGIGGDVLVIKTRDSGGLAEKIQQKFSVKATAVNGVVQIEHANAAAFVARLVESFPGEIESVTFRRPSLEDVFLKQTGHQFWEEAR